MANSLKKDLAGKRLDKVTLFGAAAVCTVAHVVGTSIQRASALGSVFAQ